MRSKKRGGLSCVELHRAPRASSPAQANRQQEAHRGSHHTSLLVSIVDFHPFARLTGYVSLLSLAADVTIREWSKRVPLVALLLFSPMGIAFSHLPRSPTRQDRAEKPMNVKAISNCLAGRVPPNQLSQTTCETAWSSQFQGSISHFCAGAWSRRLQIPGNRRERSQAMDSTRGEEPRKITACRTRRLASAPCRGQNFHGFGVHGPRESFWGARPRARQVPRSAETPR